MCSFVQHTISNTFFVVAVFELFSVAYHWMRSDNVSVDSSWNVMAHGDAREGKWRGNWRMEWVASTLHTTSEHGVSSITTAYAHTSAASSRLNWRPPGRFKWTRPFRWKTKSDFCACANTFQTQSTNNAFMRLNEIVAIVMPGWARGRVALCCQQCCVLTHICGLCCIYFIEFLRFSIFWFLTTVA